MKIFRSCQKKEFIMRKNKFRIEVMIWVWVCLIIQLMKNASYNYTRKTQVFG